MRKLTKSEKKTFLGLQLLLLVYSLSGICSKMAAGEPFLSPKYILYYGMVLFILAFYAIGWQQVIKRLPLITAYASKAVTVIWGVATGAEPFSWAKVALIAGLVACVVGLKLVGESH